MNDLNCLKKYAKKFGYKEFLQIDGKYPKNKVIYLKEKKNGLIVLNNRVLVMWRYFR